jgi:hypothetical protein
MLISNRSENTLHEKLTKIPCSQKIMTFLERGNKQTYWGIYSKVKIKYNTNQILIVFCGFVLRSQGNEYRISLEDE